MTKLKITDGDLIIVMLNSGSTADFLNRVRDSFQTWLTEKELHNVKVMVASGGEQMNITVLTVNDVFEDEVLK